MPPIGCPFYETANYTSPKDEAYMQEKEEVMREFLEDSSQQ